MYQVTSSKNFSETVNSTQVVIDYKIIGDIDSITESSEFQKLEKMINQNLDNQFSVIKNKILIDFYDKNEGFSSTSTANPIFDITLNEEAVFIAIGFVVEGNIMENVLSAHFSLIEHFANKMISDFSKSTDYQIEKEYSVVEKMSHSKESIIVFDNHEKGTECQLPRPKGRGL